MLAHRRAPMTVEFQTNSTLTYPIRPPPCMRLRKPRPRIFRIQTGLPGVSSPLMTGLFLGCILEFQNVAMEKKRHKLSHFILTRCVIPLSNTLERFQKWRLALAELFQKHVLTLYRGNAARFFSDRSETKHNNATCTDINRKLHSYTFKKT